MAIQVSIVELEIAKSFFQAHRVDCRGRALMRKRYRIFPDFRYRCLSQKDRLRLHLLTGLGRF